MKVTDAMVDRMVEAMVEHSWMVDDDADGRARAEVRLFLELALAEAEDEDAERHLSERDLKALRAVWESEALEQQFYEDPPHWGVRHGRA